MVTLEQLDKHNRKIYKQQKEKNFLEILPVAIINLEKLKEMSLTDLEPNIFYVLTEKIQKFRLEKFKKAKLAKLKVN